MSTIRYTTALFAGALLVGLASPADAQLSDARWLPFIGCWEAAEEADVDTGLLCFRAVGQGVEMTSIVDGAVVATETLVADGQPRSIVAEGCDGTESVEFSTDGDRVFTSSDITCAGDERLGTGVMAFVSPSRWIDVRALRIEGEMVSWVQTYRMVGGERLAEVGITSPTAGLEEAVRGARLASARAIDVDDVTEAVATLDSEAVTAWVAAQGDPFELDGDVLVELADRGVPEPVIDVMVAVSFPDRFVVSAEQAIDEVERDDTPRGRRVPVRYGYRSYLAWDPFYYGYGYSPYGFGYSRYGYGYGFGYYGGYGGYGYGSRPVILRVEPREPSNGRAVNGRGWTRRGSGGDTGSTARPRRDPDGGVGSSSPSGGSGASSSRGGSSQPASSGPRRARRRGGR